MTIVTHLPLRSLQTGRGSAVRVADVGKEFIRNLLRDGVVRFVVADVGRPLEWQPEASCFDVWRSDVEAHLAEPDQKVFLEEWLGGYAYFASQWDDGASPVIVLQKVH